METSPAVIVLTKRLPKTSGSLFSSDIFCSAGADLPFEEGAGLRVSVFSAVRHPVKRIAAAAIQKRRRRRCFFMIINDK
jgi:hypothetical protein